MVSEHTINSAMKTIIENDFFHYERNMTSDEIESTIISDFETAFGDQDKVLIKLKATPLDGLHPNYHPRA